MSNLILAQATQNGDSTIGGKAAAAAEELHFTRDEQGLITLTPYSHHLFTRDQIIPFLSRELRQALARLATYDTQEAYQAALGINIELAELASGLRGES